MEKTRNKSTGANKKKASRCSCTDCQISVGTPRTICGYLSIFPKCIKSRPKSIGSCCVSVLVLVLVSHVLFVHFSSTSLLKGCSLHPLPFSIFSLMHSVIKLRAFAAVFLSLSLARWLSVFLLISCKSLSTQTTYVYGLEPLILLVFCFFFVLFSLHPHTDL